jgi:hypothetical protein
LGGDLRPDLGGCAVATALLIMANMNSTPTASVERHNFLKTRDASQFPIIGQFNRPLSQSLAR